MSDEAEATYQSLVLGRVPSAWESRSYPSKKTLAPYVSDLLHRYVSNGFLSIYYGAYVKDEA